MIGGDNESPLSIGSKIVTVAAISLELVLRRTPSLDGLDIRDQDSLQAMDALSAYVRAAGWSRTNERYPAEGLPEITLPCTQCLGNYASVVARLIEIFSTVTARDELALYHDLLNVNCDTRVRFGGSKGGSLIVNDGVALVVGARDMLLAAAWSLRAPPALYCAGANHGVADLLSRVSVSHC